MFLNTDLHSIPFLTSKIRDYRKIYILEIKKFDKILKDNKYIIELYNRKFIDYEYINKFPYFINKIFKNYCYLFLKN